MLDIAVAYNRYAYLGNEFLTWLWFVIENDIQIAHQCDPEFVDLDVGNRMVLENRVSNGKETITIKGDTAGLEEAIVALGKGAVVIEINLIYKSGPAEWHFSLKGESLSFSGLKLPECAASENGDDVDAIILEKFYLFEKPFNFVDQLFTYFIKLRLSESWQFQTMDQMKKWLHRTP